MSPTGDSAWDYAEDVQAPLGAGQTFGAFLLEDVLGKGGMGVVYRAREPSGRRVALKLLLRADETRVRERFAAEARAAAKVRHPGIVTIHASGVTDEVPWIAYRLVEGAVDLERAAEGRPLEERVRLVLDTARAVAALHEAGVVHRDLKPENVLVDSAGQVHVTDLGLALYQRDDRLTRTGELLGTPLTMAPEQFSGQRTIQGPATDVWALGVLLYRLVAGDYPFESTSLAGLLHAITTEPPPPLRTRQPEAGRALATVCRTALHKRPGDRYRDARAFGVALEGALRSPSGRARWPWAVVFAAAVAAAGAGLWPSPPAPEPPPTQRPMEASGPRWKAWLASTGPKRPQALEALEVWLAARPVGDAERVQALDALATATDPRARRVLGAIRLLDGGLTDADSPHKTLATAQIAEASHTALRQLLAFLETTERFTRRERDPELRELAEAVRSGWSRVPQPLSPALEAACVRAQGTLARVALLWLEDSESPRIRECADAAELLEGARALPCPESWALFAAEVRLLDLAGPRPASGDVAPRILAVPPPALLARVPASLAYPAAIARFLASAGASRHPARQAEGLIYGEYAISLYPQLPRVYCREATPTRTSLLQLYREQAYVALAADPELAPESLPSMQRAHALGLEVLLDLARRRMSTEQHAYTLLMLGKTDAARDLCPELNAGPDDTDVLYMHAEADLIEGHPERARERLEALIQDERGAQNLEAWTALCHARWLLGDRAGARDALAKSTVGTRANGVPWRTPSRQQALLKGKGWWPGARSRPRGE